MVWLSGARAKVPRRAEEHTFKSLNESYRAFKSLTEPDSVLQRLYETPKSLESLYEP